MNKTAKIIILLSSFLCGSSIIFLAYQKNNHHQEKKKNNLSLKKEKKNGVLLSKEKHQELSPLVFWIIWMVILFVILIIYAVVYQYLTNNVANQQNNDQKWRFYLAYQKDPLKLEIVFTNREDENCDNRKTISAILTDDLNELANIPNFQTQAKLHESTFTTLLQEMVNYLTTYLTHQLLTDVYQDQQTKKNDDGMFDHIFLTSMVQAMTKNKNKDYIVLYPLNLNGQFDDNREANADEQRYLNQNKPLKLLSSVLDHCEKTFFKYQDEKNVEQKCFLFRRFFVFFKFLESFSNDMNIFLLKQIQKKKYKKEYEALSKRKQVSEKKIKQLFSQKLN